VLTLNEDENKDIVIIKIKRSKEPIMCTNNNKYYPPVNNEKRTADHEYVTNRFLQFF